MGKSHPIYFVVNTIKLNGKVWSWAFPYNMPDTCIAHWCKSSYKSSIKTKGSVQSFPQDPWHGQLCIHNSTIVLTPPHRFSVCVKHLCEDG